MDSNSSWGVTVRVRSRLAATTQIFEVVNTTFLTLVFHFYVLIKSLFTRNEIQPDKKGFHGNHCDVHI